MRSLCSLPRSTQRGNCELWRLPLDFSKNSCASLESRRHWAKLSRIKVNRKRPQCRRMQHEEWPGVLWASVVLFLTTEAQRPQRVLRGNGQAAGSRRAGKHGLRIPRRNVRQGGGGGGGGGA